DPQVRYLENAGRPRESGKPEEIGYPHGVPGINYYELIFDVPVKSIHFERPGIITGGGQAMPKWEAVALDENGQEVAKDGEHFTFYVSRHPRCGQPHFMCGERFDAKPVSLQSNDGAPIKKLRVTGNGFGQASFINVILANFRFRR